MFSNSSPFSRLEGEQSLHPRRRIAVTPIFAHRPVQLIEGIPDREGLLELLRIDDAPRRTAMKYKSDPADRRDLWRAPVCPRPHAGLVRVDTTTDQPHLEAVHRPEQVILPPMVQ
jgi:hypothetical protein